MLFADWYWHQSTDEIEITVEIQNDIEFRGRHGLYLIACTAFEIGNNEAYFGLQTNINTGPKGGWRNIGKGAIFSVWDVPNNRGVRGPRGSWVEAGVYEGEFLSVRNPYDWESGRYTLRISAEESDDDGRWFGFYINDTWMGSLKFPSVRGEPKIQPYCASTIEVYGTRHVRPRDIPYWNVVVEPPIVNGRSVSGVRTHYPSNVGNLTNALISRENGAVRFEVGLDYIAHE